MKVLTTEQRSQAYMMLAYGENINVIAKELNIATRTVSRLKASPDFKMLCQQATLDACSRGVSKCASMVEDAVDKIHSIMNNPDADQKLQLDAAKTLFNYALQSRNHYVEEIKALETLLVNRCVHPNTAQKIEELILEYHRKIMKMSDPNNEYNNDLVDVKISE